MDEGLDPVCKLCPLRQSEHQGLHHAFVGPNEDAGAAIKPPDKKKPETTRPQIMVAPMPDLVLRHALVKKGLLTSADLEAAERELTLGTLGRQGYDVRSEPPANG